MQLPRLAVDYPNQVNAVLAADRVEGAYFARNSQGAMSTEPLQNTNIIDAVVVATPPSWGGIVDQLSTGEIRSQWFCFSELNRNLQRLDPWIVDPAAEAQAQRRALRKLDCVAVARTWRR